MDLGTVRRRRRLLEEISNDENDIDVEAMSGNFKLIEEINLICKKITDTLYNKTRYLLNLIYGLKREIKSKFSLVPNYFAVPILPGTGILNSSSPTFLSEVQTTQNV